MKFKKFEKIILKVVIVENIQNVAFALMGPIPTLSTETKNIVTINM